MVRSELNMEERGLFLLWRSLNMEQSYFPTEQSELIMELSELDISRRKFSTNQRNGILNEFNTL